VHTVNVINCQNMQKNCTKSGSNSLFTKLRSTKDIVRKQGSVRPRSTCTDETLAEVADLEQSIIDSAIDQWRKRLTNCVKAKSGHFEYQL